MAENSAGKLDRSLESKAPHGSQAGLCAQGGYAEASPARSSLRFQQEHGPLPDRTARRGSFSGTSSTLWTKVPSKPAFSHTGVKQLATLLSQVCRQSPHLKSMKATGGVAADPVGPATVGSCLEP